ncbi:OmpA family protein [Roseomonas sp. 18066]|uniref:OmpA family protein n=1 Tax=Roseomonas sp. 18066 TaxID=2681412 RepID=UPI001356D283|nr:OmpA family protein [Roseomonas sp. 18066]
MQTNDSFARAAASWRRPAACILGLLMLAGCGLARAPGDNATDTLPMRVVGAPSPPLDAQRFDEAVASLTVALIDRAQLDPADQATGHMLVVDPLIDRATGEQTASTRAMERRIGTVLRERYPDIRLAPLSAANLAAKPLVLLGAITAVADAGIIPPTTQADPKVYRIWAVLGDLRTGKVVSHETAWVRAEEVDAARTVFYQDSPGWGPDAVVSAYLKTCASNAGDPIDPQYLASLEAQAFAADGTRAYEQGEFGAALVAYTEALNRPGGDQLRVRNGLYLSNRALARPVAAEEAFAGLVDHGLNRGRLAMKFLFQPGTAKVSANGATGREYPMWLRQIARRTAPRNVCLAMTGHASATGSAARNLLLSAERAEAVRSGLVTVQPQLRTRTSASGVGASEPLVGSGRDDATDALDRRVEFQPQACVPQLAEVTN